jgi:hypothetical protein
VLKIKVLSGTQIGMLANKSRLKKFHLSEQLEIVENLINSRASERDVISLNWKFQKLKVIVCGRFILFIGNFVCTKNEFQPCGACQLKKSSSIKN